MKLICPHCGLKGTADAALMDKKVRCPQCQKIFRLNETNALSAVSMSQENAVLDGQPMNVEIPASQVLQEPGEVLAPELGTCSVCGFSLSHAYLEEKDAKLYCRICLPA